MVGIVDLFGVMWLRVAALNGPKSNWPTQKQIMKIVKIALLIAIAFLIYRESNSELWQKHRR